MREKTRLFLQECMDIVLNTSQKGSIQNILLIKHNNAFF